MQLREQVADVAINGAMSKQSEEFKIVIQDGKVFDMLSSTIYSNKIRAIVRELSCNAIDAHDDANRKDKAFELQIPNSFDPMFKIRDYGNGLNREQMFNLYTSYFTSTKGDSNNNIGGFGIGSKSPFAYTDAFQVRSFQNGTCSAYTCYKKNGMPRIDLVVETKTEEADGLEVSFPVSNVDFARFNREAAFVLSGFDVPVIHNADMDSYFSYSRDESTFGLLRIKTSAIDHTNLSVLMGGVLYPVTGEGLEIFNQSEMRTLIEMVDGNIGRTIYVIRAEIGDFDLPPSRELIDNTEHNLQKLRDMLVFEYNKNIKIVQDIYDMFKDLSIIDAVRAIESFVEQDEQNLLDQYKLSSSQIKKLLQNKRYKFKPFDWAVEDKHPNVSIGQHVIAFKNAMLIREEEIDAELNKDIKEGDYKFKTKFCLRRIDVWSNKKLKDCYFYRDNHRDVVLDMFADFGNSDKVFTIFEIEKGYTKILQEYNNLFLKQHLHNIVFFFNPEDDDHMHTIEWLKSILGESRIKLMKFSDILPDNYKKQAGCSDGDRSKSGEKKHEYKLLSNNLEVTGTREISINDIKELDVPMYYVKTSFGTPECKYPLHSSKVIHSLRKKYRFTNIMALPKSLETAAAKNADMMINLDDLVDDILIDIFNEDVIFPIVLKKEWERAVPSTKLFKTVFFLKTDFNTDVEIFRRLNNWFVGVVGKDAVEQKITYIEETIEQQRRRIEQLSEKYPLISMLRNRFSIDSKEITEYIDMVDFYNRHKQTKEGI